MSLCCCQRHYGVFSAANVELYFTPPQLGDLLSRPFLRSELRAADADAQLTATATIKSYLIVGHEGVRGFARKLENPRPDTIDPRLDEFFSKVESDATSTIRHDRIVRSDQAPTAS